MPYEPGTIKVVGRKNGKIITEEIHTTSAPAAIRLSVDKTSINVGGQDIADVKVEVIDKDGMVVPDADNTLQFKVEGEGILAGTDNGDPQDKTLMSSNKRNAFNGLALAVIRSAEKSGDITITVSSENLKGAILHINANKPADLITLNK